MVTIEQAAKQLEAIRKEKARPEAPPILEEVESEKEKLSKKSRTSESSDQPRDDDREIEERAKLEFRGLWIRSGVPKRHREQAEQGYDVSNTEWLDAFASVMSVIGGGSLIVLTGKRGRGKTQLAVEAVRRVCSDGWNAKYVKVIEIFLAIRATFESAGSSEMEVIRQFFSPTLLVIDELEERKESSFEDKLLTHIIDKRYDSLKDTILISHLPTERIADSVGLSIAGRLQETGCVIVCDWPSFRERKEE